MTAHKTFSRTALGMYSRLAVIATYQPASDRFFTVYLGDRHDEDSQRPVATITERRTIGDKQAYRFEAHDHNGRYIAGSAMFSALLRMIAQAIVQGPEKGIEAHEAELNAKTAKTLAAIAQPTAQPTWQGMTNAEHLADCEKLEAERKAQAMHEAAPDQVNGHEVIAQVRHANCVTILVDREQDYDRYVVATWWAGSQGWHWGHYHSAIKDADDAFKAVAQTNAKR